MFSVYLTLMLQLLLVITVIIQLAGKLPVLYIPWRLTASGVNRVFDNWGRSNKVRPPPKVVTWVWRQRSDFSQIVMSSVSLWFVVCNTSALWKRLKLGLPLRSFFYWKVSKCLNFHRDKSDGEIQRCLLDWRLSLYDWVVFNFLRGAVSRKWCEIEPRLS